MALNRTQALLFQSLLELLKTRSLSEITVKDITAFCGYQRGAFYYHYKNVSDLVLSGLIASTEEVFSELVGKVPWHEILCLSMRRCIEQKQLMEILTVDISYSSELYDGYLLSYFQSLARKAECNIDELTLIVYVGGIQSAYRHWIASGYLRSPEEVAAAIDAFTPPELSALLNP